jgi:hypothetical protein
VGSPKQLPHKLSPQVEVDSSPSQPRGLTVISYSRIPRTIFLSFLIILVASVVYQLVGGLEEPLFPIGVFLFIQVPKSHHRADREG